MNYTYEELVKQNIALMKQVNILGELNILLSSERKAFECECQEIYDNYIYVDKINIKLELENKQLKTQVSLLERKIKEDCLQQTDKLENILGDLLKNVG